MYVLTKFSDDYVPFHSAGDTIVSVALVKPKHDVFVESVEYLLAIATTVQLLLCAIMVTPEGNTAISPSMCFSVPLLMSLQHTTMSRLIISICKRSLERGTVASSCVAPMVASMRLTTPYR